MYRFKNITFFLLYLVFNPHLLLLIFRKVSILSYVQFAFLRDYNVKTVIDVGAYRGDTVNIFQYLFPSAVIYAFEPLKENYKLLKLRFSSKHIHINNIALSDKIGRARFYKNKILPASSLLSVSQLGKNKYKFLADEKLICVNTTSLNMYFTDKKIISPIFLKIDTQGAEYLVIKGGKKMLSKVSMLYIECSFGELYENQCTFDEVYQYLKNLGFRYTGGSLVDYGFYPFFGPQRSENSIYINTKLLES